MKRIKTMIGYLCLIIGASLAAYNKHDYALLVYFFGLMFFVSDMITQYHEKNQKLRLQAIRSYRTKKDKNDKHGA